MIQVLSVPAEESVATLQKSEMLQSLTSDIISIPE